jgi:hypothetical protein
MSAVVMPATDSFDVTQPARDVGFKADRVVMSSGLWRELGIDSISDRLAKCRRLLGVLWVVATPRPGLERETIDAATVLVHIPKLRVSVAVHSQTTDDGAEVSLFLPSEASETLAFRLAEVVTVDPAGIISELRQQHRERADA